MNQPTEKPLPLYRAQVRQDAYIYHVTLIRAESAADACEAALDGWNGDETIKFVDEGATGFDDGECDEDDVELVPVECEAEDEADFAKSLAGEQPAAPKVWLATYEHKHGHDVRIFRTEAAADAWRARVADESWEEWPDIGDKPEDRESIADLYFEHVGLICGGSEEFFTIEEVEVEDSASACTCDAGGSAGCPEHDEAVDTDINDHDAASIAYARKRFALPSSDTIEIDDKPALSHGEGGVWVAAWVWAPVAEVTKG